MSLPVGKLEDIKIGNHTFQFRRIENITIDDHVYYTTSFYYGTKLKNHKKYWLFGENIWETIHIFAFSVDLDIKSKSITNSEFRETVMKKYGHWLEIQNREEKLSKKEYL